MEITLLGPRINHFKIRYPVESNQMINIKIKKDGAKERSQWLKVLTCSSRGPVQLACGIHKFMQAQLHTLKQQKHF